MPLHDVMQSTALDGCQTKRRNYLYFLKYQSDYWAGFVVLREVDASTLLSEGEK